MGSPFRALMRLSVYIAFTLALIPVQAVAVMLRSRVSERLPLFYHRMCCRLMGMRVVSRGVQSDARPTLFVCNHSSYLDISVLASLIPGSFVAKSEVATWPLFGVLAKLQRTVFIDRRGPQAAKHRDDMLARLQHGDSLILFPEGTSADGNRILPFKSALFSVAQTETGHGPMAVQPVSVSYTQLDGMPLGRSFRPYCAWYGDMDLFGHMFQVVGLGQITVEVIFHPPVTIDALGGRKALADHCRTVVAAGHVAANNGLGAAFAKQLEHTPDAEAPREAA